MKPALLRGAALGGWWSSGKWTVQEESDLSPRRRFL